MPRQTRTLQQTKGGREYIALRLNVSPQADAALVRLLKHYNVAQRTVLVERPLNCYLMFTLDC